MWETKDLPRPAESLSLSALEDEFGAFVWLVNNKNKNSAKKMIIKEPAILFAKVICSVYYSPFSKQITLCIFIKQKDLRRKHPVLVPVPKLQNFVIHKKNFLGNSGSN